MFCPHLFPEVPEGAFMSILKINTRLSDILSAARTVVSHLDLDRSLSAILRKAMEVSGTTAGSIALYNSAAKTLRIHAHKGLPSSFISDREWTVRPGSMMDRLLRSRSLTVITDAPNRAFFTDRDAVEPRVKALVCVPLVHQKETLGVLFVDDGTVRMLAAEDLEALEILASFAAIAIQHARTHTFVKQQAITDSLTGLFNRRCFEDLLNREFQRAERHGREFSLALVDVDDFKKFNDRYGHQEGDEALAMLGESIRKAIRATDLAARYGGDEIVIILPETRLEKAYDLFVTRIKRDIETRFKKLSGDRFSLTVTIGIASYPQDGTGAHDLVLAADRALLDAKKHKHIQMIGCSRPPRSPLTIATP
jgi:diguanylate cyclase (GGDEF)-like protein